MASGYIEDAASFSEALSNANRQLDEAVTTLARLSEKNPAKMIGDRQYPASARLQLDTVMWRIDHAMQRQAAE